MEVFHWEQEDAAYILQGPDLYVKKCHYILKISLLVKESKPQESLPAGSYGMAEAIYDTNGLNQCQLSAHLGKMNCSQVRSSAKIGIYLPPMMVLQVPAYGRDYSQSCTEGEVKEGKGKF